MSRVLLILPLVVSCGKSPDAQLYSIENYSAHAAVNDLQCGLKNSLDSGGHFNPELETFAPASRVVKFDRSIPKPEQDKLIHFVKAALTSVPIPLQEFFIFQNGIIRITPDVNSQCDGKIISQLQEKDVNGEIRLDSCYNALFARKKPVGGLNIIIRNTPKAIGHGTLRAFGFLFSEFFSHVQLSNANGLTRYSQITLESAKLEFESLHSIYKQELSQIKSFAHSAGGSAQSTFAESFDSINCNTWSPVDEDKISKIKTSSLSPTALQSIFRGQSNTSEVFHILFPKTFYAAKDMVQRINNAVREFLIRQKSQKSVALSLTSSDISQFPNDIFGNESISDDKYLFPLPNQGLSADLAAPKAGSLPKNENQFDFEFQNDADTLPKFEFEDLNSNPGIRSRPSTPMADQPPLVDPDRQIIIYNNGGTINFGSPDGSTTPNGLLSQQNLQPPILNQGTPQSQTPPFQNQNIPQFLPPQNPITPQREFGPPINQSTPGGEIYQNNKPQLDLGDWNAVQQDLSDTLNTFMNFQSQQIQKEYQGWNNPSLVPPNNQLNLIQSYGGYYY